MIHNEGPGWRLVRDTSRKNFSTLIGGENWAVELSEDEWNELNQVIEKLIDQYGQIKTRLMPEEKISIELEQSIWWGSLEGNHVSWSLKLILCGDSTNQRSVEIYWPIPTAQTVTSVMRTMWDSYE